MDGQRLDKWLWYARFCKSRHLAQRWIKEGMVRVNGRTAAKASMMISVGDRIDLVTERHSRHIDVLGMGDRRGPAHEARELYRSPAAIDPAAARAGLENSLKGRGLFEGLGCARQDFMLEQLKAFLMGETSSPDNGDAKLAAVVLLVEAAMADGSLGEEERLRIDALLRERFALSPVEAADFFEKARALQERSSQLFSFAKVVVDNFGPDKRIDLIEMLWEVVYADNRLHDYEASLVRRVAGLLYVSDHDSGMARQRAIARLGNVGES